MCCLVLNLVLAQGLAHSARRLEVPYRVPHLHSTALPREKNGDSTVLQNLSERREEIFNSAAVKPCAPHRRYLVHHLPLVSCRRKRKKGNRAVILEDPGGTPICMASCSCRRQRHTRSARPDPVSDCLGLPSAHPLHQRSPAKPVIHPRRSIAYLPKCISQKHARERPRDRSRLF